MEETRGEAVRRLEELGGAGERLGAFRRGGQNLVDSYSEMVPEALEVLPSETRHRIYKILDLTLTTRADGKLLTNMVLVEDPQSCAQ